MLTYQPGFFCAISAPLTKATIPSGAYQPGFFFAIHALIYSYNIILHRSVTIISLLFQQTKKALS
jgi:hypothetical protein